MLEEHVKANQQEKTTAQATLQELTSKATMELERGGEYNHPETALEQILETPTKQRGRQDKQLRG